MKHCSKCQQYLDNSNFVKSDRYLDGLYPSCKECRKKTKLKTLADHPLCCRCKLKPHISYEPYCLECWRTIRGRLKPIRVVDRTNKEWCSRCKQLPRLPYHNYCAACKNASHMEWSERQKVKPVPDEKRRKRSARHYINTLYKRGKIKRQPCEKCGAPSLNFHHLDYEDRTTNVQHLCFKCHVQAEREKRNLTK